MNLRSIHVFFHSGIAFILWWSLLTGALVVTSSQPGITTENQPLGCMAKPWVEAKVVRIVGSQTVETAKGLRVKLASIKVPNLITTNQGVRNASLVKRARKLLTQLTLNKKVALVFDTSKPDRYGRKLAHILVFSTSKSPNTWVQAEMITRGLARIFPNTIDAPCITQLLEMEKAARLKRTGMWKNRFYRVIQAENLETLNRSLGRLQLVEGRVYSVSVRRSSIYINFSTDWKRDFTVTLSPRTYKMFTQRGINIKQLADRNIRVRGWLDRHNGPTITVNHVAQIEILKD